jgi:hypothetical protein
VKELMMSNKKVDMRPTLGETLDNYERLSYKVETAISEFVDNATSNYFLYKALLEVTEPGYKLVIDIDYDEFHRQLTIKDNALGMNEEEFYNALMIAKKPIKTSGRSEFGMGLKTAASWFTKNWKIISKRIDESVEYKAIIDIEYLKDKKINEIPIDEKRIKDKSHYTILTLSNLKRKITPANILKLMNELTYIYKKDILGSNIEIYVNGELLQFSEPNILIYKVDGLKEEQKIEFNDFVLFENKKYPIKGFVALREKGKYDETGFTLLRYNRVILGGYKNGFKPREIFGSDNSFVSLRMFGDIEMEGWPVTQAKDDFDWEGNGLKEEFVKKMLEISKKLITVAKNHRDPSKKSNITKADLRNFSDSMKEDINKIKKENDIEVPDNQEIEIKNEDDFKSYKLKVKISSVEYTVEVKFSNDDESDLISVENNDDQILIIINSNYPFFEKYSSDKKIMNILQKLFVLIVISEQRSSSISTHKNGLIEAKMVRENINLMLRDIVFEEEIYE